MSGARPRWSPGALPFVLGAVLFIGLFFSPVADIAVRSLAAARSNGVSQRDLFYPNLDWMRDPQTFAKATAGQPSDRTSLLLMGSSELFSEVPQNPRFFLPANVKDFDLFLSGRGYTQSLYHAIELAAMASDIADRKVALIVSPQWFQLAGTVPPAFQDVFSDAAWQAMLANPRLAPQTKAALVSRVSTLMAGAAGFSAPAGTGLAAAAAQVFLAPYDQIIVRARELRLELLAPKPSFPYRVAPGSVSIDQIDWAEQSRLAAQQGASLVHNGFNIADPYYATYVEPALSHWKDSAARTDYAVGSPEWGDLALFLDVASELDVRVLLISVPMNGPWYDFEGYDAARRAGYYARIRELADRPGVQLADFSGDEYQPYFLYDTQHLGWLGWLDVIQACVRFERS